MIRSDRSIDALADPHATLAALGEGFFDDDAWLRGCEQMNSADLPEGSRSLLVHSRHMTATLNAHYEQSVELRVLSLHDEPKAYRRKILLTVDAGARVVEFGIVRLHLEALPAAARKEVQARKLPLGEIFAKHDVLTRVVPCWYLRFSPPSPIVQYFAPQPPTEAYGRLGVIHCDGQPAVELLEVVPG